MDFCHPCRRHLNGALACPGCGTPVETLRARQPQEPAATPGYEDGPDGAAEDAGEPVAGPGAAESDGYGDEAPRGRRADRRRGREPEDSATGSSAGQSRRDRKAAAHRRRRNRTLIVAAGFVLAAGALSLAELGLEEPGSKPEPATAGESPDGGSAEVETTAPETGAARAETPGETPGPGASDSASASASASPEDEESPTAEETEEEAPAAPADVPPADPATPPPAEPPAEPESPEPEPTTKKPEPEPEPSETCDRFLWWCT